MNKRFFDIVRKDGWKGVMVKEKLKALKGVLRI
jgi:hypothetical protein